MKISTRMQYAVRIMAHIAANQGHGPVRKQQIATDESLSPDYIEQILVSLRQGGLVTSHRGAKGGFTLARSPAQITVKDIVEAAEGPAALSPPQESGRPTSTPMQEYVAAPLWREASARLSSFLDSKNLKDLVGEYEEHKNRSINYVI